MDVLLKVVLALPQTAIQSEDSFQSQDATFDTGRLSLLLERGRKTYCLSWKNVEIVKLVTLAAALIETLQDKTESSKVNE